LNWEEQQKFIERYQHEILFCVLPLMENQCRTVERSLPIFELEEASSMLSLIVQGSFCKPNRIRQIDSSAQIF